MHPRLIVLSIPTLALAACAPATRPVRFETTAASVEAEIAQVEHRFAEAAARDGVRDAFLAFVDDSAIAFAPEPANAKEVFRARAPDSGRLTWYPTYVRASGSADMGFTTGPYVAMDSAGNVRGQGQYATVWRRTPNGWRFLVDQGAPTPPPTDSARRWWSAEPLSVTGERDPAATASLLAADQAFAAEADARGFAVAVQDHGHAEMRLLRRGAPPRIGLGAALAAAQADSSRRYSAHPVRAMASVSGDFGWTWGEYQYLNAGAGRRETGHYVRIWARDPGQPWRVLLDITHPRPAERDE